jgi:hypothetical protein
MLTFKKILCQKEMIILLILKDFLNMIHDKKIVTEP